jgi:hypothetical protein
MSGASGKIAIQVTTAASRVNHSLSTKEGADDLVQKLGKYLLALE